MLGTASLGRWQLHRADQKLARQAMLTERERSPALSNATLPCEATDWAAHEQRRVVLSGRWLPQRTVLLDNRQMAGRPGFFVLTPFELSEAGSCPAQVVMVQRGWLPRHSRNRLELPRFATPTGRVQLSGRLLIEPSKLFSLGTELPLLSDSGPHIVQNVELDALRHQWGLHLRPGAVLQLQAEAPADVGVPDEKGAISLLREWPAPAVDVGKHHAYAAQWFAMSALITGLYVWFQLIRPFRQRSQ
ncbi:MAG: SURF1 family protein [Pseudomonadota bacterium]